jgi:hypothetical protein
MDKKGDPLFVIDEEGKPFSGYMRWPVDPERLRDERDTPLCPRIADQAGLNGERMRYFRTPTGEVIRRVVSPAPYGRPATSVWWEPCTTLQECHV